MHPFVHAFTPAIDPPWEAKSASSSFTCSPRSSPTSRAPTSGVRKDLVSVPLMHDLRSSRAARWASGRLARDGAAGCSGKTMPVFQLVERDYTAISEKLATAGRSPTRLHRQERDLPGQGGGRSPGRQERRHARRRGRRSSGDRHGRTRRGDPHLLGHDGAAISPCRVAPSRVCRQEARRPRRWSRGESGSPSPTRRWRRSRSSPRRSGRDREWRPASRPFTVNIECLKPFHTLTGRMHFYLDHDGRGRGGGVADLPASA